MIMIRITDKAANIIFGVAATFILLPPTALCLFSVLFLAVDFYLDVIHKGESIIPLPFWPLAPFLVIPIYGLVSLWWLVIKKNSINLKQIHLYIWLGLAMESASSIFISQFGSVGTFLGIGPLALLSVTLVIIWHRKNSKR